MAVVQLPIVSGTAYFDFGGNGTQQTPYTPSLPANAAIASNQIAANTILSTIETKIPSLGQASSALSLPVVLPTSQLTALTPPTTITANLGTIAGVATAANQSTANTALGSIDNKLPGLGQAAANGSLPVVLTTAQLTTLTPPTTITANIGTIAGIATETTLSSLNNKIPSLGQALAASSLPVVLTTSQLTTLTPPTTITANLGTLNGAATDSVLQAIRDRTPVAATLTDSLLNPSTTQIGSNNLLWDGSQWSRQRQAITGSITNLTGIINQVGLGRYNAAPPTLTDGDFRALQVDVNGRLLTSSRITDGVNPISNTNPLPTSLPRVATASIVSVQTNAAGSSFNSFATNACQCLEIVNNTGVVIEYRRGGSGSTIPILDKTSRLILGITNADQIGVRRVDQNGTQVTLTAELFN